MDRSQFARQRGGVIAFLLQFRNLHFSGLSDHCFVGDLAAKIHVGANHRDEICGDHEGRKSPPCPRGALDFVERRVRPDCSSRGNRHNRTRCNDVAGRRWSCCSAAQEGR
jgi:hypothetical protein